MSTEICINYSDEILRYLSNSSKPEDCSYSKISVYEKPEFRKTLSGNVNSEYKYSVWLNFYEKGLIRESLGDLETLKKEAILDHSAYAQVPEALAHSAFVNYFGGLATIPNRKKAFLYTVKAFLQGNYDAVGLLQHDFPSIRHPLFVAYNLEFFFNSNAKSLYEEFYTAFYGRSFFNHILSNQHYASFSQYAQTIIEEHLDTNQFLICKRALITKLARIFSLGCIKKITSHHIPDDKDTKEFLHFIKCLSLLNEVSSDLDCSGRSRIVVGELNKLIDEINDSDSYFSPSREFLDKGLKIIITRLYLENYSELAMQRDTQHLKALVDSIICEFESEEGANLYSRSPYVLRLIGLYNLYVRNCEVRKELNEAIDKCTELEFCRIVNGLDIEKIFVASLCDPSKHDYGEPIWHINNGVLSYNRERFATYLSTRYRELIPYLARICNCANLHSVSFVIHQTCHRDCEFFIRSYMELDPVLAYNDCEFSKKLSAFIKYAVDKLSLPPHMLADIKKPVPFYGYTPTSAAGLYLLGGVEGEHWDEFFKINENEYKIAILRQQIVELDLKNIVQAFALQKDNPSENYDYLLKEFLHKLCCFDLELCDILSTFKIIFSYARKLLRILISRAKIQRDCGTGGIAAECLSDLLERRHFLSFFERLADRAGRNGDYQFLKKKLDGFEHIFYHKYPNHTVESLITGDCREYGLYVLNRVNSDFETLKIQLDGMQISEKIQQNLKHKLTCYYRLLLAYHLCNPLDENKILFRKFEEGYINSLKTSIYTDNATVKIGSAGTDDSPIKIPSMIVSDPDLCKKRNSTGNSSDDSGRIKDKIKAITFERNSNDNRELSDDKISPKHYELPNSDKPLHILGNRKLSEVLNEKIIKVLKSDPKKMKKYGLKIAPNFILFGEPGCGKTEAVRQFCEHLDLEPVVINSSTIGTSKVHETPVKIHNLFEEAFEKKNSVIIIDEADSFLNEREGLREDLDYKVEEVNAFLQCIDKAVKHHTLVISMTNYLNKIDKAILRDGRLGIHIEITKPDEYDLQEIIEHSFEKSELEKINKTEMALALNGQSIASVFSIINGIRMEVVMNEVELSHQYVMQKINSSLGYTLKPGAHFSLPGQQEFEDYVNKNIVDHLLNPNVYRKFNLRFPNSILLYGPTGTGKTYAAKELAKFLGWNFIKLDSKAIGSENVQGSAIKISKVFDRARREAPCIIFIDEIDAWLPKRSDRSNSSEISQVNEFLTNMSQVTSDNLLLIGTTNRIDDIDEAALRHGRFSTKIEIGYMKGEQVEELLQSLIKDIPYDEELNLKEIARTLNNKSVADIVAFFEKACRYCAENKYDILTEECFNNAMDKETKQEDSRRIGFL